MKMKNRICKVCKSQLQGRLDKIFCSVKCKNSYHRKLRKSTAKAVLSTDKILHRNRSILLEVMGPRSTQKIVDRIILDQKKFNYNYETGRFKNDLSRIYHRVYDFSWTDFSEQEVLIIRKR